MSDGPLTKEPDRPPPEAKGEGADDDGQRKPETLRARMLERSGLPVAYRLNYVANRYTAALYGEIAASSGLDRARFVAMLCLSQAGEATAQEIAQATHRPKNSLSRAIRQLEKDGLVRRRTDPNDSRRQPMQLTKKGENLFATLMPIAEEHEQQMLAPLTPQDIAQLERLLGKLANSSI